MKKNNEKNVRDYRTQEEKQDLTSKELKLLLDDARRVIKLGTTKL